MKETVEIPQSRKCIDNDLPVIMPSVPLPAAPKFKWGDFDEEEVEPSKILLEECSTENNRPLLQDIFIEDSTAVTNREGANSHHKETSTAPQQHDISTGAVGSLGNNKERFRQRLWCYLFENLSRAIDELYFLCELECDMEQIHEARLVFNEAGLDFGELNARVENFDTLKKAAAAASGVSVDKSDAAKLDQRPHAIAWEVRRMTSSPRRADILSMSLEAFKKVQSNQDNMQHVKRRNAARFLSFDQLQPAVLCSSNETVPACAPDVSTVEGPQLSASVGESSQPGTKASSHETNPHSSGPLEAWKEKRNWEDILSSPLSSGTTSPGVVGRKTADRGRVLHDKLMSPERRKKTPLEMKKEVDEKQARATRIRRELENERALRLQRTTEKLNRVSEWQAVKSTKLREGMHARHQRGESRHEAHLAQIARRASDESSKVSEVRFITSLNEENKKLSYQQKLQDSELRRAERLQNMRIKQKEDVAREEAALERRKLLEAERLQRIAETQRKKEEAQARREEERRAASAAREARAVEQVRKKEIRAKAQEEEVELLRQKLAERLRESALRRKIYLEQIRERAVMDTREQGSPMSRRPSSRDGQSLRQSNNEAEAEMSTSRLVGSSTNKANHQVLKKRIKKIRQRLTTRRFDFVDEGCLLPVTAASRSKVGRWVQELQRLQQARKAGASASVLIIMDIVKYLEGKETELHVARHTGLVDFIASAIGASHSSKPEASQMTMALLKVLVVLLSLPANRGYFLARNFLPPLVPILSAALEKYSSVGCSNNVLDTCGKEERLVADDKFDAVGEVLEDLLKCITLVMGHSSSDDRQLLMQDDLVELVVACDVIHRLRNLFALFDRPQIEGAPFPPPVLLGLKLLDTLTRGRMSSSSDMGAQFHLQKSAKKPVEGHELDEGGESVDGTVHLPQVITNRDDSRKNPYTSKPVRFLLLAIAETGLVGLPSLLTAVLLQANPRVSSPEQAASALPSNFEEVATSVLRMLNDTACLDLSLVQTMLAMPDLKMEFFHLVSFLLSYCTCKWKSVTDQVASLLLETLLLLGYFALLHPGNQAVLRWGKSPTILHKICDLPFAFFSDPELTPVLAGTLLAACYGSERNRDVIQQELSMELVLSVLKDSDNKQGGIQSAEALLSKQKRMDAIAEEPGDHPEDRVVEEMEVVAAAQKTPAAQYSNKKGKSKLPLVFLLENRFPCSLWEQAAEFFSLQ